ncbi:transcriptional regulator [Saccharibacillus sp. O16]|nr:transcriptional regulator [Saccharibacillus sp. O16]
MTDKVIRIFNIVNAIQANPGISAADLALKCDTTIRTVYRDLELLSSVTSLTNEGRGSGYRFIGKFAMYPLDFTEEEALALSLLPSMLDRDKRPPGFDTAHDKIMATHRKEKSRQSGLLENIADIIQMGTPAYRQEGPNYLQPIIQGILEKRTIDTVYHTQYRNETTRRPIDPYYLIPREQRFYLVGYCHLKQAIRTFRVSRFHEIELSDNNFDRGDFNIRQYLKNTWSIERGEKNIRFKVRFSPNVARYIKEEELFVHPWMKDLPDGSLLFEVTVNNEKEFLKWIQQYGPDAEILEPVAVRERMKDQLARWMELYKS